MNWMTTAKRRLKQNSGNKFNSKANDMNNLRNNQTKTKTQNQNHNHNNNQNQQPKLIHLRKLEQVHQMVSIRCELIN